jgi:hypothetical protein
MALTATTVSAEPRAWSIGPLKMQIITFTVANGDTTGTVTADRLSSVAFAHVSGLDQTAAPTFSGNVITLAFADPTATRHGQIIVMGK